MTTIPLARARSFSFVLALPWLASCACLCVSCDIPDFESRREVRRTESGDGVRRLVCESHNGEIVVRGSAGRSAIDVLATLSARGDTQQEADANCAALDLVVERRGDDLVVRGKLPDDSDWRLQPSFAFTIEVPAELAADLTSHNGQVRVEGTKGELVAKTHNGGLDVVAGGPKVALETHNGHVDFAAQGDGPLSGSIVSHNGGLELRLGSRACTVEASTNNGSVSSRGGKVVKQGDDHLTLEAGQGGGSLTATTHNGSISVTAGAN